MKFAVVGRRHADDLDLCWRVARDEHAQPAGELQLRYRRQYDEPPVTSAGDGEPTCK
jgi:hypothetical protein